MSKVLIIAEHADGNLNPSTAKCVSCAAEIPDAEIHVAVFAGNGESVAAEAASLASVSRVIRVDNDANNNPLAAAKAFSNHKQYWSDFSKLINSDFLKARRSGLRMNVNEADIADMAKKGGPRAVINKLLQLGFAPTQIADSFAIASGGATFYRNRINTYKKQGLSQQEAETKAFYLDLDPRLDC